MVIKAVLFDADGVIQETSSSFVPNVKALVPEQTDQFVEALFAMEKPAAVGQGDFRSGLKDLIQQWNISKGIDEVIAYWYDVHLIHGLFDLLAELKQRGLRVALATNQQSYRMDYMRHKLALDQHFDECFYSCEVGFAKPDLAYFEHVVQALGVPANQCLFIDDNPNNVTAAQQVGLQAVLFKFDSLARARDQLTSLIHEQG